MPITTETAWPYIVGVKLTLLNCSQDGQAILVDRHGGPATLATVVDDLFIPQKRIATVAGHGKVDGGADIGLAFRLGCQPVALIEPDQVDHSLVVYRQRFKAVTGQRQIVIDRDGQREILSAIARMAKSDITAIALRQLHGPRDQHQAHS